MTRLTQQVRIGGSGSLKVPRGLRVEALATYLRIPPGIQCVEDPSFEDPDTAERLFGPEAEQVYVPAWCCPPEVPEDRPPSRARPIKLTARQEAVLFLRYNYARLRLQRLIVEQRRRCCLSRAVAMVMWYQRVLRSRGELVRANMALVLAMAKRANIPSVDFLELASEGNMALLRSIEKFDVARGFKFSTYACRAILKAFNRLASRHGRYRQRFPVEFDADMQKPDLMANKHQQQWDESVQELRQILSCNLAAMTDLERRIVMFRFGLASKNDRMTLSDIGKKVGFSNERVRQILNSSLQKLRESLHRRFLAG
ncbi:MAG: sigma-70 family RNA polymerase sigma factor [Phycisphaerae bacterium]|nr:sigma-70 family RNA polymerase sigma factor [Phycisphaerae bacterium]